MLKVTIIGVDLAKNVFQLHGAAEDGSVVFRKAGGRATEAAVGVERSVSWRRYRGTNTGLRTGVWVEAHFCGHCADTKCAAPLEQL
jgi:hypothetical protein